MFKIGLIIVIIILIIWVWHFQFNHPTYQKIWLHNIKFKTGDIILFKAQDNWNGPKIACYFGHIGVVYIDPKNPAVPMLFEAAGTTGMHLQEHQNEKGIFCEPIIPRLQKYKGYTFYKALNKEIPIEVRTNFKEFIEYAKQNMSYEYSVGWSSLYKGLGLEKCHHKTNCGEITMLSLIKLEILSDKEYDKVRPHHLRDMCYFTHGINGYRYLTPMQIMIDPFS